MTTTIDDLFLNPLPKFDNPGGPQLETDGTWVDYQVNSLGYRTQEPETFNNKFILALGCSHTQGTGHHIEESWTYKLSKLLDIPVANFGQGGAGADLIELICSSWIKNYQLPTTVIVQWPNPLRWFSWREEKGYITNLDHTDNLFQAKSAGSELNFYVPWIQSINLVDQLWAAHKVPVLHCYFATMPTKYIPYIEPVVHSNDIANNNPWLFDGQAHDLNHHSDWCTTQWTNRIKTLLTTGNFNV
jgi:hypothetical protein